MRGRNPPDAQNIREQHGTIDVTSLSAPVGLVCIYAESSQFAVAEKVAEKTEQ
jgi:hypothetical protein